MKLIVKVLNGQECTIAASPNSVVSDLKEQVQALLSIPVADQKLVFKGKSLLDDKYLKDYSVDDGCKLTLVVKKSPVPTKASISPFKESASVNVKVEERSAWRKMMTFLRRHFCEKDAEAVLQEFKKEFEQNLSSLSLDDIERLAITKLRQA